MSTASLMPRPDVDRNVNGEASAMITIPSKPDLVRPNSNLAVECLTLNHDGNWRVDGMDVRMYTAT